ncbi:uncharacterized protein MYCFIDRAFT_174063 [Pseudocercospora fijiensis CIRAD86]|uniref:Secreted protein n=1 Tax=Pseudocercospora fijiensis (strain CIRAD86) TaxID=383855 RepID=M3B7D5_PSEFD|nr:uncharacterized protein MYCFIDRAFT_174063 [Pseudocercospora fijiensis CIRAD86]EME85233.1 hypothetical protein MYCFIDRAFT_174063 [Pseudocercospora fijiensis CIRAD86]
MWPVAVHLPILLLMISADRSTRMLGDNFKRHVLRAARLFEQLEEVRRRGGLQIGPNDHHQTMDSASQHGLRCQHNPNQTSLSAPGTKSLFRNRYSSKRQDRLRPATRLPRCSVRP